MSAPLELTTKLEFYETTCELLKKEIPKFIRKKSEMSKSILKLSNVLKDVASIESNPGLKDCMFKMAGQFLNSSILVSIN